MTTSLLSTYKPTIAANGALTEANVIAITANALIVNASAFVTSVGLDVTGQANIAYTTANLAYAQANNSYSSANLGSTTANNAYGAANTAYSTTLSAYAAANTAYTTAVNAYGTANTAYNQANNAYAAANNQPIGKSAYAQANNAYTAANNAYSAANNALPLSGGVVTGSLQIANANFTVGGNSASSSEYGIYFTPKDASTQKWMAEITGGLFQIGTGTIIGTNPLVTLNNGGYFGIGTASPIYTLDVNGSANISSTSYTAGVLRIYSGGSDGSNTYADIRVNPGSNNMVISARGNTGKVYLNYDHGAGTIFSNGAGGTVGSIDANGNAYFAGNVGIGTSSPSYLLDVSGQVRINSINGGAAPQLILGDYTTVSNSADIYMRTTGLSRFLTGSGGTFTWGVSGGSEEMRLDSSGNLGLGVVPSAWTSGNKGFDIGTYTGIIDGSGGAGGPGILGNAYEYSSNNFKYKQNYYATLYRSNYSGQHQWFVAPSGTAANTISFTQAMTLDNSGHLLIGDTNNYAGSTLYVNNSISTNYSGSVSMRYNSSGASTNYWKGITGTQIGLSQTARGLAIFNYDADSNQGITFYPAAYPGMNSPPSPSMTLDSSGNLGIGTTTTTFRLNVSGRSTFIPSSENYAIYMAYNSSTAGVWLGSPAANVQAFYDYVGNERMRLDTSGNLLVNYDSSSFSYHTGKLSVFTGTGGADELYFIGDKASQSQNSNSPRINLVGRYQTAGVGIQAVNTQGYGGKDLVISMHNSSDYTTYYEAMRLTSSGRLGIGTSSPASSLDINVGTVGSGNTLTALTLRSADLVSANQGYGVGVNFYSGSELTAQIIAQNSSVRSGSGQLSFYTNSGSTATSMNEVWRSVAAGYTGQGYQAWYYSSSGSTTEAMRIDSSGRLGIGTTSPTAPLEMVGSANNTIVASNAILKVRDAGGDGIAVGALLSSPYQVYIQAGYLGNGYSPAFNGGYSLLLNPVGGNVGIGTTSPSYPLHVSGSSYLNGRVLIGSAVGYCFWSGNFINQGSYVHFKLNQTANSSTMFNIEGIGYDYGSSQTIGCMWCGYCYSGSNTVINTGTSNYGSAAGVANNIYTSSDGYAVIVAYVPQQYFFQIELNQITIGEGFRDIQVLTYAVANSNSGVF